MRSLLSKVFVLLLLSSTAAFAQARIDQLGAGGGVSGTDGIPTCQTCGAAISAVRTTASQWLSYIQTNIIVPLTTNVSGILPVANGGSGTASPALVAGTNVTITGSWPNQTINSSGGGGSSTGFGVDGGTAAVTLTASCVLGTGASCSSHSIRLVKIGALSGAITIALDAIANLSSDSEVCLDDQGGNITGTNTLTVTANAADSIANGSAGGSDGPFTSVAGVCYRVTATHNWTRETSAIIPSFAASTHNFVTGLSALGAWSQAQPAFTDISGSASSTQLSTNLSAALDSAFSSTQGSVLYRGASTWAALGPGTSGNFLKTQGAAANPIWAAVSATGCAPAGTQFEVLLDSGGGGCADVSGLGSTGQVLTSNGAGVAPTWQPGGGSITCPAGFTAATNGGNCLWTKTANNTAASLAFTGLTLNDYRFHCSNIISSNSGNSLAVQFGEGPTPAWKTTGYNQQGAIQSASSAPVATNFSNVAGFLTYATNNTGTIGMSFDLYFHSLATSGVNKIFTGQLFLQQSGGTEYWISASGDYEGDTTAITAIRLVDTNSNNILSGPCTLEVVGN